MSIFYLIRHAHVDWIPDEQRPLSPKGQEDSLRLADMLCNFPITGIYSSPYKRARQTVTPLARRVKLPILIEPDLRERKLGGESFTSVFFEAVKQTWFDSYFTHPGGESNAAAQKRGVAIVQRLREQYPGRYLVLSTHGNLMALVLQHYDPSVDFRFWMALTMPDIYVLDLSQSDKPAISRLWSER